MFLSWERINAKCMKECVYDKMMTSIRTLIINKKRKNHGVQHRVFFGHLNLQELHNVLYKTRKISPCSGVTMSTRPALQFKSPLNSALNFVPPAHNHSSCSTVREANNKGYTSHRHKHEQRSARSTGV